MRTRRSASSPAAAAPGTGASGDAGGGILASIPSLPSSSSARIGRRPGSAAAAASSATKPKRTPSATVKNDGTRSSTTSSTAAGRPRLRLEDEDAAGTSARRPRTAVARTRARRRADGASAAGAGGGPTDSPQTSKSSGSSSSSSSSRRTGAAAAARRPPASSSRNQPDRRSGGSGRINSNPTPKPTTSKQQKKEKRTATKPSLRVSAKVNTDDAVADADADADADATAAAAAAAGNAGATSVRRMRPRAAADASNGAADASNGAADAEPAASDRGADADVGSSTVGTLDDGGGGGGGAINANEGSGSGPGANADATSNVAKGNAKEPVRQQATDRKATTTSAADTNATTKGSTADNKGSTCRAGARAGLPPKQTTSAAATCTTTTTSSVGKKRAPPAAAVAAKPAGAAGGKPPTPRSASSSKLLPSATSSSTAGGQAGGAGRARPPLPGGGTVASGSAVRGGRPPTPRGGTAGNATDAGSSAAGAGTGTGAGAKRTTFLSGYNLDCTKTSSLLDLPDPPTPEDDGDGKGSERQQGDRKAKRRRRMSTGAAAFGGGSSSRRNIGPPSGGDCTGDDTDTSIGNTTGKGGDCATAGTAAPRSIFFDDLSARARRGDGKGQRRKVRNSLCHVPSPAETSSMAGSTSTPNSIGHNDGVEINNDQAKKPASLKSPEKDSSAKADNDQDIDDKPSPLGKGGIVFDGDDDGGGDANSDGSATKKRRKKQQQRSSRSKKRQSVFLPSDLMHVSSASGRPSSAGASNEDNDANGFYSDLLSYKASATSTASADSSMSLCSNESVGSNADADEAKMTAELPPATCDDPDTANLLLQAVREICSLPESERHGSDQAGVVEMLGGYPYIPLAKKELMKSSRIRNNKKEEIGEKGDGEDLNWTFSPNTPGGPENGVKPADDPPMSPVNPIAATLERRKELILSLGPVVERMEAKRKEDTDAARQATGCRVSRTKKGRYRYYDVDTGDEVVPEEYKRRYLAMLDGNRRIDQDDSAGVVDSTEASGEVDKSDTGTAKSEDSCLAAVAKDALSSNCKDIQAKLPDQETSAHGVDMSIDEDGEDMDISLMSMQDVENVGSKGADGGETIDRGSLKVLGDSSLPKSDEVEEEKVASPAPNEQDQSSSSEFILPLPDRDDPDTDPQIAAAERRLWSDIDAALARYSREVISIRAARKMGFTLSQTADSPYM